MSAYKKHHSFPLKLLLSLCVILCGMLIAYAVGQAQIETGTAPSTEFQPLPSVSQSVADAEDADQIDRRADKILAQIVTENMNQTQQVRAIYDWAKKNISYVGCSEKNDWREAAWDTMTTRCGDCYSYFSVCKLFFERLGIPNLDVEKQRTSEEESQHYWSMVSVDGGETWYHFDATPRIAGGEFCMVSDSFLDQYSQSHGNCFRRDTSLYPATPENNLP